MDEQMMAFANSRSLLVPTAKDVDIHLIGCGGTGSWLAPHIARIARLMAEKNSRKVRILFHDPDRVEAKNVYRQSFANAEIGLNKAEALAYRCAAAWGVNVVAVPKHFDAKAAVSDYDRHMGLFIGCVDNAAARRQIAEAAKSSTWSQKWWLDCGNSQNSGQILLGRSGLLKNEFPFGIEGKCTWLPLPSEQLPELLVSETEETPAANTQNLSCAELALIDAQGLSINARMAAEAADVLLRMLVTGDLRRYQAYLNLSAGSTRSRYITEEAIAPYINPPAN